MIAPDFQPPSIVWTAEASVPESLSGSAVFTDIRAVRAWRERELEFAAIRNFGEDWDGRGSDAPTAGAMEAAALFLASWKRNDYDAPPARLALSPSGFLNVDWLDGEALVRAEILDLSANEIEWMKAIPGQPTEFFSTRLMEQTGPIPQQVQTWQPAPDELALAFAR